MTVVIRLEKTLASSLQSGGPMSALPDSEERGDQPPALAVVSEEGSSYASAGSYLLCDH